MQEYLFMNELDVVCESDNADDLSIFWKSVEILFWDVGEEAIKVYLVLNEWKAVWESNAAADLSIWDICT